MLRGSRSCRCVMKRGLMTSTRHRIYQAAMPLEITFRRGRPHGVNSQTLPSKAAGQHNGFATVTEETTEEKALEVDFKLQPCSLPGQDSSPNDFASVRRILAQPKTGRILDAEHLVLRPLSATSRWICISHTRFTSNVPGGNRTRI